MNQSLVCCKLTWNMMLCNINVNSFEDPIMGFAVDKESFIELYGPLLETLDGSGSESWVDFFFEQSPLNFGHWEFINNAVRQNFLGISQKMGLVPSLQEICEGEDEADKVLRKSQEQQPRKRRYQQLAKKIGETQAAIDKIQLRLAFDQSTQQLRVKLERNLVQLDNLRKEQNELEI